MLEMRKASGNFLFIWSLYVKSVKFKETASKLDFKGSLSLISEKILIEKFQDLSRKLIKKHLITYVMNFLSSKFSKF